MPVYAGMADLGGHALDDAPGVWRAGYDEMAGFGLKFCNGSISY